MDTVWKMTAGVLATAVVTYTLVGSGKADLIDVKENEAQIRTLTQQLATFQVTMAATLGRIEARQENLLSQVSDLKEDYGR